MIYKICCISDTHSYHNKIKIPKCDLLLCTGDYGIGSLENLREFHCWLKKQPVDKTALTFGNHDTWVEKQPIEFIKSELSNCHVLFNESCSIDGIKIFGSPYSPKFLNWAYMASEFELSEIYSKIPKNTDIIISHSPPHAILDSLPDGKHVGSYALQGALKKINPKLFVCGHIHGSSGEYFNGKSLFVNASLLDEDYKLVNEPYNLDWNVLNNKINLTAKV